MEPIGERGYLGLTGQYGIAHRGGAVEHLENSPSAFANALALDYPVIETDLQLTEDGVLVVTHDTDFQRTAGDRRRVSDFNWSALRKLKLHNGESPMRFEELLESDSAVRFNVDPKTNPAVPALIGFLQARPHLVSRICVGSFDFGRLSTFRAALPHWPTGLSLAEVRRLLVSVRLGRGFRFPDSAVAVQVPLGAYGIRIVNTAFVDFVQSHGRHIQVWTINDEKQMKNLLKAGVNAVMTDRPTALKKVMQDMGNWQPRGSHNG